MLQKLKVDLSEYTGIQLRVKGDGQIYKVNLKTSDRPDNPEDTYAATFATSDGEPTKRGARVLFVSSEQMLAMQKILSSM